MPFKDRLKLLREQKGLSQEELGKSVGLSKSTIGMYEQGRREPDSATLLKIANLFKVSVDFFLESKESKRRAKNAEEIANKIKIILKGNSGLKNENLSKETIEAIVEAVKQGIKEALSENE